MPQAFDGIDEKLKRANENIRNLESEITGFFQECPYPVLPENDKELLLKGIEYHKNLVIPPRFSVLAGEIIHHLRSCFDHLVWHFSTALDRVEHVRQIEFPIFEKRPVDKKSIFRYEGKIKAITNTTVCNLIERLQPYNSTDPTDSPIAIIHNFDVSDKHRELVLFSPIGVRQLPIEMQTTFEAYQRNHPELTFVDLAIKFKGHGQLVPQISFRDFGRREIQPVVPGLIDLFNYAVNTIKAFSEI